ncbi:MAG: molecular chaperone HtpG [Proteobacteria bacterium]|nr:MAG: molecular chaperone HtpG [Pseudomonadota bacterium]
MSDAVQTHRFEAEVSQVLRLVINSLYSNKEIFLRELVSNASDALDKLRYRGLTDHALAGDTPLEVRLSVDEGAGTVTIEDTGVGMSQDELVENLGTVAHSGSRAFAEALAEGKGGDVQLIGQFGVGFYSAYLVADRVEVLTRAAGGEQAWRWVSDGSETYTIEPVAKPEHGTAITLHLKEDQREFASAWKLRQLVTRYSDYISYPIKLREERPVAPPEGQDEGSAEATEVVYEQLNKATALWQRAKSEIEDDEYVEFYKHLTHDWDPPLTHTHFKVEGRQLFTGVLFVPAKAPFDLYSQDQHRGVRLHVKRVFIMDDARELVPLFLRFIRGVIDSDDLPLNVSRELLQDSASVRFIKKQLTKKALDMLDALAKASADDYVKFWESFGPVLKEGLHTAPEYKDRIAKLVRYKSTASDGGWTCLAEYAERMPEGQKAIYYVIGDSESAAASSPYLEALTSRGYEVLYMTDPIDEWAVAALAEFDEVPLQSAMRADLSLDDTDEAKQDKEAKAETFAPLIDRIKAVLGDRVGEVRLSERLTTTPACLVVPEGAMHAHLERLLQASQPGYAGAKRIFEVNGDHPLVRDLEALHEADGDSATVAEWIEVLFNQALLSEGSRLEDPNRFVEQVTRLLEAAARRAVGDATEGEDASPEPTPVAQ